MDVGNGPGRPAAFTRRRLTDEVVVSFLVTVYMTSDRFCLVLLVMKIFGIPAVQLLLWIKPLCLLCLSFTRE